MTESARSRGGRARRGRLSRSSEFDRVFRQGRSHANRYLVLYAFPRGVAEGPRLGVSVSRRVGAAVDRNRVKRLLREAFAAEAHSLPADHDFVVVARPDVRELVERDGMEGLRASLGELAAQVGERAGGESR